MLPTSTLNVTYIQCFLHSMLLTFNVPTFNATHIYIQCYLLSMLPPWAEWPTQPNGRHACLICKRSLGSQCSGLQFTRNWFFIRIGCFGH